MTQFHESYTRRADTGENEAADAAELAAARVARKQTNNGRAAEELAKSAATIAQQHAADAAAAEQEALVAAAEDAAIATRQTKVVLHLRMTSQIQTKMRATTTILTTMMTQLTETTMVTQIKCRVFGHKIVLCK